MRWSINGFSQEALIERGLDAIDSIIIRFISDFYISGKMEKMKYEDGKEYYWLHLSHLLAELPILDMSKRVLDSRLKRYCASGLMDSVMVSSGLGVRLYIRFNEDAYCDLVSSSEKGILEPNDDKESRKRLKEAFAGYFSLKALELRGERLMPQWGAKEWVLLKSDHAQLGEDEIRRCMKLFFSDDVPEVKEFTRTKNKAGYSYTVFHGVLSKLSLCNGSPPEPCYLCGWWRGHDPGCEKYKEQAAARAAAKEKEKEDVDPRVSSLTTLFQDVIKTK